MVRAAAHRDRPEAGHGGDGDTSRARMRTRLDHLLVISGLSGAGKSQASKLFEDLGYSVRGQPAAGPAGRLPRPAAR